MYIRVLLNISILLYLFKGALSAMELEHIAHPSNWLILPKNIQNKIIKKYVIFPYIERRQFTDIKKLISKLRVICKSLTMLVDNQILTLQFADKLESMFNDTVFPISGFHLRQWLRNRAKLNNRAYQKQDNYQASYGLGEHILYKHYRSLPDLKEYIKRGACLDLQDSAGKTALHNAAYQGKYLIVEMLVNAGADINKQDHNGNTVLMHAVQNADIYKNGKMHNLKTVKNDKKMLIIARLLRHDIDINKPNNSGITPLLLAVDIASWPIMRILVEKGAYVGHVAQSLMSSYTLAIRNYDVDALLALMEFSKDFFLLHDILKTCIIGQDYDLLSDLFQKGFDINMRFPGGENILMYAIMQNGHYTVPFLLHQGADVSMTNYKGQNALMIALAHHKENIASTLIQYEQFKQYGLVDTQDIYGRTVLMYAAYLSSAEVLESLLKLTHYIDAHDNDGRTVLMYAIQNPDLNVVKLLCTQKVNIDYQDSHGNTALMLAAKEGKAEHIKVLLTAGANTSIQNHQAKTFLDHIQHQQKHELLDVVYDHMFFGE